VRLRRLFHVRPLVYQLSTALTGTSDFGTIISRAFPSSPPPSPDEEQQAAALLTYNLYLDRLLSYLSSYLSSLFSSPSPHSTLHGLVFSGGIGERSSRLRRDVLRGLKWIEELSGTGGGVDEKANEEGKGGRRITKEGSRIISWVVETDEELESVRVAVDAVERAKQE
jgi:acetate kinase